MNWLHTELFILLMPVTVESPFLTDGLSPDIPMAPSLTVNRGSNGGKRLGKRSAIWSI